MKKVVSAYLILSLLLFMNIPVYSKVLYEDLQPATIQKKEVKSTPIKPVTKVEDKPKTIFCKEENNDAMCKALSISKTEVPLKSYIKNNYKAYSYSIKNTSGENIEILGWNNSNDPGLNYPIKQITDSRIRFPKSLYSLIYSPFVDVMWISTIICPPLMGVVIGSSGDEKELKKDVFLWITAPVSVPLSGVWYTVASPYYYVSDKIQDKKAKQEVANLIKVSPVQAIKPNQELEFIAITDKKNLSWFRFKQENSDIVYTVNK